ncbi:MAG TPA: lactate utilization protein [Tepidisphaeraceae bacterium]|jgi:L-lactate utilization protein LutC|nr:lactate utilization protein [Tepidisphaeraceae bacterium]
MIERVRRALGRSQPLKDPPSPPEISDSVARLAPRDANLVDLFAASAVAAKFHLDQASADQIGSRLVEFLQLHQCRQIGICVSPLLERLGIEPAIRAAHLTPHRWDESTLDAAYDLDCGITDVYAAVAETGSLVIRPSPGHGRALSLVPPIHIAIVEPSNIVPDLIDLMDKIAGQPTSPNITLITGPSKTADIEGSLVTGVHGPGLVQIFLLRQSQ